MPVEISYRVLFRIFSMLIPQFLQPAFVELHRIGKNREHNISFSELIILCELYRGKHISNTRYAQQVKIADRLIRNAPFQQVLFPGRFIEKSCNVHAVFVVYGYCHVSIAHVVDPGYVFITYSFDAVTSIAAEEKCWAL